MCIFLFFLFFHLSLFSLLSLVSSHFYLSSHMSLVSHVSPLTCLSTLLFFSLSRFSSLTRLTALSFLLLSSLTHLSLSLPFFLRSLFSSLSVPMTMTMICAENTYIEGRSAWALALHSLANCSHRARQIVYWYSCDEAGRYLCLKE